MSLDVQRVLFLPFAPLQRLLRNFKRMSSNEQRLAMRKIPPAMLLLLCAGGIDVGYNGLKTALLAEHTYESACGVGEPVPCTEQLIKLDNIFQWTTAGLNGAAVFVGIFLDHFDRRITSMLGSLLWVVGFLVFALSPSIPFDSYAFGLVLSAIGGCCFFFAALELEDEFAEIGEYIFSLFTITWDLAACVFMVLSAIYFDSSSSLATVLSVWGGIFFLLMFAFAYGVLGDRPRKDLMPQSLPHIDSSHAADDANQADSQLSLSAAESGLALSSDSELPHPSLEAAEAKHDYKSAVASAKPQAAHSFNNDSPPQPPKRTFAKRLATLLLQDIWQRDVFCFLVVHAIGVQHCYFYMTSVLEQVIWVSGDTALSLHFLTVFSALVPATGIPDFLLIGYFLDRTSTRIHLRYLMLAAGSAAWTICACIPSTSLQYVTFIIFLPWRIYGFTCIYSTVKLAFQARMQSFGALSGLVLTVGGLLTFINVPLLNLVMNQMNGNFLAVNLINSAVYIVACLACAHSFLPKPDGGAVR